MCTELDGKWEKQAIATRWRSTDDSSHVVVIFTTNPLDNVAVFARNHFDVRTAERHGRAVWEGCEISMKNFELW